MGNRTLITEKAQPWKTLSSQVFTVSFFDILIHTTQEQDGTAPESSREITSSPGPGSEVQSEVRSPKSEVTDARQIIFYNKEFSEHKSFRGKYFFF